MSSRQEQTQAYVDNIKSIKQCRRNVKRLIESYPALAVKGNENLFLVWYWRTFEGIQVDPMLPWQEATDAWNLRRRLYEWLEEPKRLKLGKPLRFTEEALKPTPKKLPDELV